MQPKLQKLTVTTKLRYSNGVLKATVIANLSMKTADQRILSE